jgi:hypothetical protein
MGAEVTEPRRQRSRVGGGDRRRWRGSALVQREGRRGEELRVLGGGVRQQRRRGHAAAMTVDVAGLAPPELQPLRGALLVGPGGDEGRELVGPYVGRVAGHHVAVGGGQRGGQLLGGGLELLPVVGHQRRRRGVAGDVGRVQLRGEHAGQLCRGRSCNSATEAAPRWPLRTATRVAAMARIMP